MYQHDAFVSYRRSDGAKIARWLRSRLERFRLPPELREGRKASLVVYLDEVFEVAANDFFDETIRPALEASRYLIIVATPDALRTRDDDQPTWQEREIEIFRKLPQGKNLLIVRGDGELPGPLPGGVKEFYPNAEEVDLRAVNRPRWRRGRLHKHLLKLVAPLFDIESHQMPLLHREEAERRQRRLRGWALAATALLVVVSGLAVATALNLSASRRNLAGQLLWRARTELAAGRPIEAALALAEGLELDPTDPALLAATLDTPKLLPTRMADDHLSPLDLVDQGGRRIVRFSRQGEVEVLGATAEGYELERRLPLDVGRMVDLGVESSWNKMPCGISTEGSVLVCGTRGEEGAIWDLDAGLELGSLPSCDDLGEPFVSDVTGLVAVSRGANLIAVPAWREVGGIQTWRREPEHPAGFVCGSWLPSTGHIGQHTALAIDPSQRFLVAAPVYLSGAGHPSPGLEVWDLTSGNRMGSNERLFGDLGGFPRSFDFSPQGDLLAVGIGGQVDEVLLVNLEPAAEPKIIGTLSGHRAVFSPDGSLLATASGRRLRLYQIPTETTTLVARLEQHFLGDFPIFPPHAFVGSRDLLSGGGLWRFRDYAVTSDPEELGPTAEDRWSTDWQVEATDLVDVLASKGDWLGAAHGGGGLRLWRHRGSQLTRLLPDAHAFGGGTGLSPNGELLAVPLERGGVGLWRLHESEVEPLDELRCAHGTARLAAFASENRLHMLCDSVFETWWVGEDRRERTSSGQEVGEIESITADGRFCVARSDSRLEVLECVTGRRVAGVDHDDERELGPRDRPLVPEVDAEGRYLALPGETVVRLWDLETGGSPRELDHPRVVAVAFDQAGLLATGSVGDQPFGRVAGEAQPGRIRVWGIASGTQVLELTAEDWLETPWHSVGAAGSPPGVGFSSLRFTRWEGRLALAAGRDDGELRIFGGMVPVGLQAVREDFGLPQLDPAASRLDQLSALLPWNSRAGAVSLPRDYQAPPQVVGAVKTFGRALARHDWRGAVDQLAPDYRRQMSGFAAHNESADERERALALLDISFVRFGRTWEWNQIRAVAVRELGDSEERRYTALLNLELADGSETQITVFVRKSSIELEGSEFMG